MRRFFTLIVAALTLVASMPANGQTCGGPVTRVTGDKGYTRFLAFPSNATVDATGAIWRLSQYPTGRNLWPLGMSGRTNPCLHGGAVVGDTPLEITWGTRYSNGNAAAIIVGPHNGSPTTGAVVQEGRFHNTGDGPRVSSQATNTTLRGNWVTKSYDDCIENDGKNVVLAEDNLLDGCFDVFSARNPKGDAVAQPNEVWTIKGNLVRLEPVPGWPSKAQSKGPAHFTVFKWEKNSLKVRLTNNVFNFSQGARTQYGTVIDPFSILGSRFSDADWRRYVIESSGNVIVWTGPGQYPFAVPPGFTVTTDRGVWDRAKQAWLQRHPTPASAGG